MEIVLTRPIEEFIRHQMGKGYANPSEVVRQAILRWMEEEEFDLDPPQLEEKLAAVRQGAFRPFDPQRYEALILSQDEASR